MFITREMDKEDWHIYTMECYSAIKGRNNAIFSNMDGPRNYHIKWSQSVKDKYHMISLVIIQMNIFIKQKQKFKKKNKKPCGYQKGKVGGEKLGGED